METQVVKEAVDALGKSFHDFKQANDERLLGLEKKAILDPLLEEKVDQLNNAVDKAQERVEILETAQRRPDLEMEAKVPNGSDGNYKAAFLHYVRKGVEEPLQQFESKALSSGSDPEGGYLVPTEISQALLGSLEEFSSFRKLAKVTSISTDMLEVLVDAQTAEAGWVSEE
ncbi:MAG: phage major capsid protein, partial [Alphaproteobacteria bacterium]|nr:phage major capsid protein [Alphaproteobacteria bacterium]